MKAIVIQAAAAIGLVLSSAAQAAVIATDSSYGLFDRSFGTRILNIASHGSITDLNITVEFSKCDDPPIGAGGQACLGRGAPFENEITFQLISPGGQKVNLVNAGTFGSGTVGAGRVSVTFDDEAESALGTRVQEGVFRPVGLLSDFYGMDMFGSWSLYIEDNGRSDPLEYYASRLVIEGGAAAVPEPATAAILGFGLLGMGAASRRARKARG